MHQEKAINGIGALIIVGMGKAQKYHYRQYVQLIVGYMPLMAH